MALGEKIAIKRVFHVAMPMVRVTNVTEIVRAVLAL